MVSPRSAPMSGTFGGIKSRSTLGGGPDNYNEIRFEDKKGSEEFHIQAERDQSVLVKRNQSITVNGDRSVSVGGNDAVLLRPRDAHGLPSSSFNLIWVDNGIMFSLMGTGDDTTALNLAGQIE